MLTEKDSRPPRSRSNFKASFARTCPIVARGEWGGQQAESSECPMSNKESRRQKEAVLLHCSKLLVQHSAVPSSAVSDSRGRRGWAFEVCRSSTFGRPRVQQLSDLPARRQWGSLIVRREERKSFDTSQVMLDHAPGRITARIANSRRITLD
jgi:hypothetical protein